MLSDIASFAHASLYGEKTRYVCYTPAACSHFLHKPCPFVDKEDSLADAGKRAEVVISSADRPPSKKARVVGPGDVPNKWNHLWHTFWGKLAPECTVERYVRIPDARTLDVPDVATQYEYLTLPNDGLFPCDLSQILIIGTYKSLYTKLCEQDKLYVNIAQSDRLLSLSHSTIITGQPGIGEPIALGISVPLNNRVAL